MIGTSHHYESPTPPPLRDAFIIYWRFFGLGQVIRAIEATAEAEERGVFRAPVRSDGDSHGERSRPADSDRGEDNKHCCEKHAFQLERSSVHLLEERARDTLSKVCWALVRARSKKGRFCSLDESSALLCFFFFHPCRRLAKALLALLLYPCIPGYGVSRLLRRNLPCSCGRCGGCGRRGSL